MTNKEEAQKFYDKEVTERRTAIDDIVKDVKNALISLTFKNSSSIGNVARHNSILKKLADMSKPYPQDIATKNQIMAAVSAKKHCYHYSQFVDKVLQEASSDKDMSDFLDTVESGMPEKVKYYILQAKKCYHFESYDACIVMIARAIEFSIKEYLKKEGFTITGASVMGNLILQYEKYGKKQDIMKYVLEVQKMDRNICAHDSDRERQAMGKDEADHSWTAVRIILKELLNVNLKIDEKVI